MASIPSSNSKEKEVEDGDSDVDFQDAVDSSINTEPVVNDAIISQSKIKTKKQSKAANKAAKNAETTSTSTASIIKDSALPIESEDTVTTPQPQLKESTEFNFDSSSSHEDAWTNQESLSPMRTPNDALFTSGIDSNGNEHYGLQSPSSPTKSSFSKQQSTPTEENKNGIRREGKQSIAGAVWRNSLHAGSGGILEDVTLGDEERKERVKNTVKASGRSKAGESGSEDGEPEEEEDSYQFLLQRLDAQNTAIMTDAKVRQSSAQTSTKIRASFDRLQKESEEDASLIDWAFWGAAINNYEEVATNQPRELSRAIQQGIPSMLRGSIWQLMSASKDLDLENTYAGLLKETSPHEKNIRRDLSRTYPKHEYFKETGGAGQENLFNVVKAYSLYDADVGYTQGIQFIVGPLLLNMPDEEAFSVLVRLMKSYDLRSHYAPDMPGLQLRLFQFDRLLEELLPGLFMHLLRQGIKSSMYASQWLLTMFGYRFPMELITSVFDLVFAEGVEAIFRFSVAILKKNEEVLCAMEFEKLIEFLRDGVFAAYEPENTEDGSLYRAQEFVRDALLIKITPLMLDQFGEEWETICRTENAQTLEIETLRKANAQLTSQVKNLETTLSQINLEHCDLVKQVVMSKIEREELEDELVKYKIAFADMAHQQASEGARLTQSIARDWEKK